MILIFYVTLQLRLMTMCANLKSNYTNNNNNHLQHLKIGRKIKNEENLSHLKKR